MAPWLTRGKGTPMGKNSNFDLIQAVGELRFGPRWQRPLADVLGYNERTIGRWKKGEAPVPAKLADGSSLYDVLLTLLGELKADIAKIEQAIRSAS